MQIYRIIPERSKIYITGPAALCVTRLDGAAMELTDAQQCKL